MSAAAERKASRGDDRQRGVRRSAMRLALLALAIYAGFILTGVLHAG